MLKLLTPTVLLIEEHQEKLDQLKPELTYTDQKVEYELKRFKKSQHWYASEHGEAAASKHMADLKNRAKTTLLFTKDGQTTTHSGLAHRLATKLRQDVEIAYDLPQTKLIPTVHSPQHKPRDYQVEAFNRLIEAMKKGPAGVEIGTGLGKSTVIEMLIRHFGLKTLVMAPSTSIAEQIRDGLLYLFGSRYVGQYFGGKKQAAKLFVVGVAASLTKVEKGTQDWKHLSENKVFIADECFPYNVGVKTRDGVVRPIGSICNSMAKGKMFEILSFNRTTEKFEYKKASSFFKKPMKDLIRIDFTNSHIVTTHSEPLLTTDFGWVPAEKIKIGMDIVGYTDEKSRRNAGGIRFSSDQLQVIIGSYLGDGGASLHSEKVRMRIIHGKDQESYLRWKADLLGVSEIEYIEQNGYAQKPAFRFTTKTFLPPFQMTSPKSLPIDMVEKMDWKAIAIWFMDDGSWAKPSKYKGRPSGIGHAVFNTQSLSDNEVLLLVTKLKSLGVACSRYWEKKKDGRIFPTIHTTSAGAKVLARNISQYMHPSLEYKLGGIEKVGSYQWQKYVGEASEFRVTKISDVPKKIYPKRHDYLNYVYDLEIEDNNNFVAFPGRRSTTMAGIVAHNSHLCPAATLEKVNFGLCKDAPYRAYFSGTQIRNDGLGLLLEAITGPIVMSMTVKEGVDQGFLSKPIFKMVKVRSPSSAVSDDANVMTRKHLFYNPNVNRAAGQLANKFVGLMQRPTIILIDEVEQFAHILPHLKHEVRFAHGPLNADNKGKVPVEYQDSDPNDLVAKFNKGEFPILVGTSCITTGTDIRVVEAAIYLMGGKSEIQIKQAVGRGTRGGLNSKVFNPWTGKQKMDCFFVDFDIAEQDMLQRHAKARRSVYKDIFPSLQEMDMTG